MFLKDRKKKGMTLIEIIISLAILAVLIVPIANLVIKTSDTSRRAQDKQKASIMGQSLLEEIGNVDKDIQYNDMIAFTNMNGESDQIEYGKLDQINCGNSKYKAKVTIQDKAAVDNKKIDGPTTTVDQGTDFFSNYNSSALPLEIAKDSNSSNTFTIYNPVAGIESQSCNVNNKYMIVAEEDGTCNLYSTNATSVTEFKEDTSTCLGQIGTINSSSEDIRIHLIGKETLIINSSTTRDKSDSPFDFESGANIGFVSNYDSNFRITITKGENVKGSLKMGMQARGKNAHTINKQSYQAKTDNSNNIGNLYEVTVSIENEKNENIFEGSTTCYLNK